MKLYLVEYTVQAVVMADDESHAFTVALESESEAMSEGGPDVQVLHEVKKVEDLQGTDWNFNCVPYGGDRNSRIGEILEGQP